jgi:PleD family two-component response regulator
MMEERHKNRGKAFGAERNELGHLAGDEVLTEVGRRLKSEMRIYDAVGGYGAGSSWT